MITIKGKSVFGGRFYWKDHVLIKEMKKVIKRTHVE